MNNDKNWFRKGLNAVFGDFQWGAPPWARKLGDARREKPRRFWTTTALILLLPLLALAGYRFWQMLPQPVLTHIAVDVPGITRVGPDGKLYPKPLVLRFQTHYTDARDRGPRNAARLDLLGKVVNKSVTLEPAMPGEWRWLNENTLRFEPDEDWPAEQQYSVRLKSTLFADGVQLADNEPEFTTPAILAKLEKLKFYQNPKKPGEHRVVATLVFTHAVDVDSLKAHLTLGMRPSGSSVETAPTPQNYTLKLDKQGRIAYVTTAPLSLPEQENFMQLTMAPGVAAAKGPAETPRVLEEDVRIPAVSTFFRVDSMQTRIVRNPDNNPEQTLLVQFTDGVETEVVTGTLKAWVLPDNERWQRDEITPQLLARSQPLTLHANPTEHDYAELQSFRYQAPEDRQIYVKLPAGLVSHGKFKMTVPYSTLLRAPDYPREARVVGEGSLLAMTGDRILSLQARGVPALKVELFRLLDDQITHLITQTRGDLSEADFAGYRFDEENISEQFERVLMLNADSPAEAVYASLDLDPYLKDAGHGVFVMRVQGWDPVHERRVYDAEDRRLVLVTDLSVIAKDNADGAHELFVHSLGRETPVSGARVALLGQNGQPVVSATTNNRGHAQLPNVEDFDGAQEPAVYLVRYQGDIAFLPFNRSGRRLNYSRFSVGGIHPDRLDADERLKAVVFTDRGIYRPGESGHLAVMVKHFNWRAVEGVPVEITITNPKGNIVQKERVALPASGFVELPLAFAATDPTGVYRAQVHLLDEDKHYRRHQLGSTTFSVEAFQPDTMRIRTTLEADKNKAGEAKGWRTLDSYQGRVTLENLFGLPAQNRRVKGRFTLSPARFHFDDYADYVFEDPFRKDENRLQRYVVEDLPEQISNAEGKAVFEIDLSAYGRGLFHLGFKAEGFEPGGGRSVTAYSRIRVSPAERLVGWKSDGNLNYLRRGSEHKLYFVAVNPELESIAAKELQLTLVEKRPISTLVRQANGTLAYQTVTKRKTLSESEFLVAEGGSTWPVPTDTPGEYVAELRDAQGLLLAEVDFTVIGERNLAGKLDKQAKLELTLDQTDYRAGEMIELQITTPYTGTGLITIERDKVYAYQWFHADSNHSVQSIRVPKGLEGNGYVNVTFVRSLDSEAIFTNPLSYAVAPFEVDRSRRTVEIELNTPKKIRPGDPLTIEYQTDQPARIIIYAVDEGILQVAAYRTPQPLDTFLQKRALEVETSQMADLLMPEFKLLKQLTSVGGDATLNMAKVSGASIGANLNPFQRNVKQPVVYWSGIQQATGKPQSLQFTVPDYFDGELRVMAVAAADGAAGSADSRTRVRGPFVLQPNVITTAAPGDEFVVSVGVTNALPANSGDTKISVHAMIDEHLIIPGESSQTLILAPGREGRVEFTVRALDKLGAAEIIFSAQSDKHQLSRTATLSVRPAVPYRTRLYAGIGEDGEGQIQLERQLLPALAEQKATVGYSPLILAGSLQTYLEHYPHACSEQIVSRVFPVLMLANSLALDIKNNNNVQRYHGVVNSLLARQRPDGGFGFWPGSRHSDAFVSIYVMHFLTDAAQKGLPVPRPMRRTGLDYLRQLATRDPTSQQMVYEQAYATYILTRNGKVTTNYLTRLQEHLEKQQPDSWQQNLTAAYMAASYRQLKLEDLAQELIADYQFAEPTTDFPRDMDSALARNAQYVYLLARHFPERLAEITDARLQKLITPILEERFNTLSSAYTMLALGAWGRQAGDTAQGELAILASGKGYDHVLLASGKPPVLRHAVPLDVHQLHFTGDGAQRLFYTGTQSGYDTTMPDKPVTQGMEIVREFINQDGEVVTTAPLGAELTVRLRVRALDNQTHRNVAVVDLLPGGFAVQRDSVRGKHRWNIDYVDIREDRLVLYGTVTSDVKTFTYRVKLTGQGRFVIPPAFAESMYHPDIQAQSVGGHFMVTEP